MKQKQPTEKKERRKGLPRTLDGKMELLYSCLKEGETLACAPPRVLWNHAMVTQFRVENDKGVALFIGHFRDLLYTLRVRREEEIASGGAARKVDYAIRDRVFREVFGRTRRYY